MKAKNCVKGVKVKNKDIRFTWRGDVPKGTLGVVQSQKPDIDGDVRVRFETGIEIYLNVKCLSKVKE